MKYFIPVLLFVFLHLGGSSVVSAQSVEISPVLQQRSVEFMSYAGPEAGEGWSVSLNDATFRSISPDLELENTLDYDFSPDGRHIALLREVAEDDSVMHRIEIYSKQGDKVGLYGDIGYLDAADPSLKLFLLENASVVLRDNIVGFTIYTYTDLMVDRVSNSSGSPEGETMSRLISSEDGSQVFVYNPRILHANGGYSSRISRLSLSGELETVFSDGSREILNVTATQDGSHIFAVMSGQEGRPEVLRINSDGDVTASHEPEMDDPGFYVQPELGMVTWFERNNAQSYLIETGDRIANAFFSRQNIVFAMYNEEDNIVLTITGNRSNRDGRIEANGIRVVDLDARSLIHSDDLSHTFRFNPEIEPRMYRTGPNRYQFLGVNNAVNITVNR